jgi:hypothetical protein
VFVGGLAVLVVVGGLTGFAGVGLWRARLEGFGGSEESNLVVAPAALLRSTTEASKERSLGARSFGRAEGILRAGVAGALPQAVMGRAVGAGLGTVWWRESDPGWWVIYLAARINC